MYYYNTSKIYIMNSYTLAVLFLALFVNINASSYEYKNHKFTYELDKNSNLEPSVLTIFKIVVEEGAEAMEIQFRKFFETECKNNNIKCADDSLNGHMLVSNDNLKVGFDSSIGCQDNHHTANIDVFFELDEKKLNSVIESNYYNDVCNAIVGKNYIPFSELSMYDRDGVTYLEYTHNTKYTDEKSDKSGHKSGHKPGHKSEFVINMDSHNINKNDKFTNTHDHEIHSVVLFEQKFTMSTNMFTSDEIVIYIVNEVLSTMVNKM